MYMFGLLCYWLVYLVLSVVRLCFCCCLRVCFGVLLLVVIVCVVVVVECC